MLNERNIAQSAKRYIIASLVLLAWPAQAQPWIVGDAASAENGELLYRELHYRSDAAALLSERVEYVSPAGELLVQKTLDSSLSPITPNVEQSDLRSGTRFSVSDIGDALDSSYQRSDESMATKRLDKNERLVVDAGFDPYVRAHWEALWAGRPSAQSSLCLPVWKRLKSVFAKPMQSSALPLHPRRCASSFDPPACCA
jgi:hypothetical protein